jgi:hypothetical protein
MFLRLCWRAPRMRMVPWDMSAVFPEEVKHSRQGNRLCTGQELMPLFSAFHSVN